ARSIGITLDAPADLARVLGCSGELNQVWMNLVDNAIDAVDASGRIELRALRDGDNVLVTVVDNGSGIPPDIRNRIFDPFFTTKPIGSGTGLGLDIVRRLVQQHSGAIEMESEPGRTEFRVRLPAVSKSSSGGAA